MAGRQIKLSKGAADLYDAGRGHVYAEKIQPLPQNLKKKIAVILEAIPTKSKSEIAEVLQACDYDVDRTLNSFIADGEMEGQNEWTIQGKKKNKKKKRSGKKSSKDGHDSQVQDNTENNLKGLKTEKTTETEVEKTDQNIPNGTVPQVEPNVLEKTAITQAKLPRLLEDLKPVADVDLKPEAISPLDTSPPVSPPLLSPTESVSSSQDSQQTPNKSRPASSANEKLPRARTPSTSGHEVIKKSHKDLQRSSVSIARYQSMLDEQADSSTKTLAKSFQAIRQALDERETYLAEQLQSVLLEAKKLLEQRQADASLLNFKCNRVGSMSDEETTELRNEIKHFVGERRIDEDLGKTLRFLPNEEKMAEAVKNFGEVLPIKHHYTPYKRKHPEPTQPTSQKPAPQKTTTVSTNSSNPNTTSPVKADTSSETKSSNTRNDKRPVLSPSRLKEQAEMHVRLQQAVKEQQVTPVSKEGNKQSERNVADTKAKPKDFGSKPSRGNSGRGQQNHTRRERIPPRQRQTHSANHMQNSTKSPNNRGENKANGENSKNPAQTVGTKAPDVPADNTSQARDDGTADNGSQAREKKPAGNEVEGVEGKASTAQDKNDHMTSNHGNHRRTRRRYIRKTPANDGSPVFKTGTSADSPHEASAAKENGNDNGAESRDWSSEKFEGQKPLANGTNGFVPLPQRNRRQGRFYYRRDPGSKIEFPPNRENPSVPA